MKRKSGNKRINWIHDVITHHNDIRKALGKIPHETRAGLTPFGNLLSGTFFFMLWDKYLETRLRNYSLNYRLFDLL